MPTPPAVARHRGLRALLNRLRRAPIRHAGQLATALWCLLGALTTTAIVTLSPPGLLSTPEEPLSRAIGVPNQPGSRLVACILAVLEEGASGSAPVWVVQPQAGDSVTWALVQQQLAHLAYPRRVDVLPAGVPATDPAAGSAPFEGHYGYAVALGVGPQGDAWEAVGGGYGLTLYRRRAR